MLLKIRTLTSLLMLAIGASFFVQAHAVETELYFERKPCIFFCEKTTDGDVNLILNKRNGEYSKYYKVFFSKREYYDFCASNTDFCKNNYVVFDSITDKAYSTYDYESVSVKQAVSVFRNIPSLFDKLKFAYQPISEDLSGMEETYRSVGATFKAIYPSDSVFLVKEKISYNEIVKEDLFTIGKAYLLSNSSTKKMEIEQGFIQWASNDIDYGLSFGTVFQFSENSSGWVSNNGKEYGFVNAYENCPTQNAEKGLFRWIGLRLSQDYELYNKIHGNTCLQDYLKIKSDKLVEVRGAIENDMLNQGTNFLDDIRSFPYGYYKTNYAFYDVYKAIEEKYSMSDLIKFVFKDADLQKFIVKADGVEVSQIELQSSPYRPNEREKLNEPIFSTSDVFRFTKVANPEKFRIFNDGKMVYLIRDESIRYLDEKNTEGEMKYGKFEFKAKDNKIVDFSKNTEESLTVLKRNSDGTYSVPAKIHRYKDLWMVSFIDIPNFLGTDRYAVFIRKDSFALRDYADKEALGKLASPIQFSETKFTSIITIDKNTYTGFPIMNTKDVDLANTLLGLKIGDDKNYIVRNVKGDMFFVRKVISEGKEQSIFATVYAKEIATAGTGSNTGTDFLNIQKKLDDNKNDLSGYIIKLITSGFYIKNSSVDAILLICKEAKCAVVDGNSGTSILQIVDVSGDISTMTDKEINDIYHSNVNEEAKPQEETKDNNYKALLTFDNVIKLVLFSAILTLLYFVLFKTDTIIGYFRGLRNGKKGSEPTTNETITEGWDDKQVPVDILGELTPVPSPLPLSVEGVDLRIGEIKEELVKLDSEKDETIVKINISFEQGNDEIRRKIEAETIRLNTLLERNKDLSEATYLASYEERKSLLEGELHRLFLEKKRLLQSNGQSEGRIS